MKISWQDKREIYKNASDKNGYGSATKNIQTSLTSLGYEWSYNNPTADVGFVFDQPEHCFYYPGQYRILLHPWESSALLTDRRPNWLEQMNSCDEIWTPSPLIADWYRDYMGIKPPVYVYEHGVDPVWRPVERKVESTFRFLHVGGEAARKGLKETMQALRLGFPKSTDVELTSKIMSRSSNAVFFPRIKTISNPLPLEDLIQLFHDHHAYVYPSYGEGFGLTPLQAMATGMPTITVPAWAPYSRFLDERYSIGSSYVKSPWPRIHPGMMLQPDMDDLIAGMRFVYNNYEAVEAESRAKVEQILHYYDWDRLTQDAFKELENRLRL